MKKKCRILIGDVRKKLKKLKSNSVHCVITSPPYYRLRDYGTAKWKGGNPKCTHKKSSSAAGSTLGGSKAVTGHAQEPSYTDVCKKCGARRIDNQIGIEKTIGRYVSELVDVFREVRRVLRTDGTFWLNLGDSYSASEKDQITPGNLLGIPWRVAFAMQAAGWILRQEIIWHKPSVMPESVRNRCTKAHEHVFLFTKKMGYFYDNQAIREKSKNPWNSYKTFGAGNTRNKTKNLTKADRELMRTQFAAGTFHENAEQCFTNKRSVWTIAAEGSKTKHFAAYPKKLVRPMILAGTSQKGCCRECGAPYIRRLKKIRRATRPGTDTKVMSAKNADRIASNMHSKKTTLSGIVGNRDPLRHVTSSKTIGWKPTCDCDAGKPVPCVVLDPFGGTGTTAVVALAHNRRAILIELNPEYAEICKRRTGRAERNVGFGF